jgi:hypothetical protein
LVDPVGGRGAPLVERRGPGGDGAASSERAAATATACAPSVPPSPSPYLRTCFPPVSLGGHVFDLETSAAIAGARVVARDANFAAVWSWREAPR